MRRTLVIGALLSSWINAGIADADDYFLAVATSTPLNKVGVVGEQDFYAIGWSAVSALNAGRDAVSNCEENSSKNCFPWSMAPNCASYITQEMIAERMSIDAREAAALVRLGSNSVGSNVSVEVSSRVSPSTNDHIGFDRSSVSSGSVASSSSNTGNSAVAFSSSPVLTDSANLDLCININTNEARREQFNEVWHWDFSLENVCEGDLIYADWMTIMPIPATVSKEEFAPEQAEAFRDGEYYLQRMGGYLRPNRPRKWSVSWYANTARRFGAPAKPDKVRMYWCAEDRRSKGTKCDVTGSARWPRPGWNTVEW